MQNKESCVIHGETTTIYFKLERGTRQGGPISAYLFILVLETAFLFIMQNENNNGLNIFGNTFYTQRMQMILHFFLKTEICNKVLENIGYIFDIFWTGTKKKEM